MSQNSKRAKIGRAVRARIEDGTYADGDLLPTGQLAEEFGVCTDTVNAALRPLGWDKLVWIKKGTGQGTCVGQPPGGDV